MKPKLFYPASDYFKYDIFNAIHEYIKPVIFKILPPLIKNLKRRHSKIEKLKFIDSKILETSELFDIKMFDSIFEYKLNIEENIFFINQPSIELLIERNNKNTKETLTLLTEEFIQIQYVLNEYKLNKVNDREIFVNKFLDLNTILLQEISFFCCYDYLINLKEHITKNDTLDITLSPINTVESKKIKWHGTQTELIELIKALIEKGTLKGTQKIINKISNFFEQPINNPDKLIQDIKNRNIGSETLFLDKLKSSLYDFVKK